MIVWLLLLAAGAAPPPLVRLPPEVVRVEGVPPERVQLSVSVLDRAGEPVVGLTRDDFVVEEDGRPQTLVDFSLESRREDRPLSVAFLVDRSGSVRQQMGRWREACAGLASALRPIDQVRLATFTTEVDVLADFTSDPNLLSTAVEDLTRAGGGTDIFGSVEQTLRDLRYRPGRKVLFLLTDGLDEQRSDVWSTENDSYLSGLVRQAVAFQTTIVTILPGPTGRPFLAAQDLAVQTGGWWLYPSDDLPGLVKRLGERLLESYYLAYDSLSKPADRKRRRVEVHVRDAAAGLQVRTVAGVFGDTPVLEALEDDLDGGDEDQRVRAAAALGSLRDPRGGPRLIKALRDESPKVRAAAAEALGRRGDASATKHLARLLRDGDGGVREAALAALKALMEGARDPAQRNRILEALEEAD